MVIHIATGVIFFERLVAGRAHERPFPPGKTAVNRVRYPFLLTVLFSFKHTERKNAASQPRGRSVESETGTNIDMLVRKLA